MWGETTTSPAAAQTGWVGLSTVRARAVDNESVPGQPAEIGERFGNAVAIGDFDADGAEDLAIGAPGDNGLSRTGCASCGAVTVRAGVVGGGLAGGSPLVLSQQVTGTPDPDGATPGDDFGATLAAGDFDGDGYVDLAVGVPGNSSAAAGEGAVQVHLGGPTGLDPAGDQFLRQGLAGVPGTAAAADYFGFALAVGDFDGDGRDDLAISALGDLGFTGSVTIAHGGAGGLLPFTGYSIDQELLDLPDGGEVGDLFGFALAAADFDDDGHDDLAIGAPGENGTGRVVVLFGSDDGLDLDDPLDLDQGAFGGVAESDDFFASSLAAGDWNGDGYSDLAAGAPRENHAVAAGVGEIAESGVVGVLSGSSAGFDFASAIEISEATVWLDANEVEPGDQFGFRLNSGDFDGDSHDDLVITHPFESLEAATTGAVTVLPGKAAGLVPVLRARRFSPGREGTPGDPSQDGQELGFALAAGDLDGDGFSDLAVGAPGRDASIAADTGAALVFHGALFADGFEAGDGATWESPR